MAEQKIPAARKAAATGAVSGHTKTSRVTVATAAKKPAVKKTAATAEPKKPRAAAVKKTAAPATEKKSPVKKASAAKAGKAQVSPEERYRMVQTAAYFIAERNGFLGYPDDHWLQAELEIAAQLRE
jgi:hypothetical protein